MKLVEVALENFRGYAERTVIKIDDLTVLIGANDSGKSSVMEALHIVLGDGAIDASDICVRAKRGQHVAIECVFTDLPSSLSLDAGAETCLEDEFLLDSSKQLRLRWSQEIADDGENKALKKKSLLPSAVAIHPYSAGGQFLHSKKITDLRKIVKEEGLDDHCKKNNNASMRTAIWEAYLEKPECSLKLVEVPLATAEGKVIYDQLEKVLPRCVLFRSDRASTDQDAEVQDPMKVAIGTALEELKDDIQEITGRVRERAEAVAGRTLESLADFDESLAQSLTPEFEDPKLDRVFRMRLMGDDGIAVNKRGSGIRRLVLFSFFRAEADRGPTSSETRSLIYAVEEPETAQHPDFQKMVVRTLTRLSETGGRQVIATTHSPGLAGLMPTGSVRFVEVGSEHQRIILTEDPALDRSAKALGVIPDHRVRLLVCVEGGHDRSFLQAACNAYRDGGEDLVCLSSDPRIAMIPLGGSVLKDWVERNALEGVRVPEFHIYDRDKDAKYAPTAKMVNDREDDSTARMTTKREMENYCCPKVIKRVLAPHVSSVEDINFGDEDDVIKATSNAILDHNGNAQKKIKRRDLKDWLNNDVAQAMTAEDFSSRDPGKEVLGWLREITALVQ